MYTEITEHMGTSYFLWSDWPIFTYCTGSEITYSILGRFFVCSRQHFFQHKVLDSLEVYQR